MKKIVFSFGLALLLSPIPVAAQTAPIICSAFSSDFKQVHIAVIHGATDSKSLDAYFYDLQSYAEETTKQFFGNGMCIKELSPGMAAGYIAYVQNEYRKNPQTSQPVASNWRPRSGIYNVYAAENALSGALGALDKYGGSRSYTEDYYSENFTAAAYARMKADGDLTQLAAVLKRLADPFGRTRWTARNGNRFTFIKLHDRGLVEWTVTMDAINKISSISHRLIDKRGRDGNYDDPVKVEPVLTAAERETASRVFMGSVTAGALGADAAVQSNRERSVQAAPPPPPSTGVPPPPPKAPDKFAANWLMARKFQITKDERFTWFVNRDATTSNGRGDAFTVQLFVNEVTGYVIIRDLAFNCNARTSRYTATRIYNREGQQTSSTGAGAEVAQPSSGTSATFNFACSNESAGFWPTVFRDPRAEATNQFRKNPR